MGRPKYNKTQYSYSRSSIDIASQGFRLVSMLLRNISSISRFIRGIVR